MLKMNNITKTFNSGTVDERVALDHLTLTLHDGDFVTVIGGNGAGKSPSMVYPMRIYSCSRIISLTADA